MTDGLLLDFTQKLGKMCTDAVTTIENNYIHTERRRERERSAENEIQEGNFASCINTHTLLQMQQYSLRLAALFDWF